MNTPETSPAAREPYLIRGHHLSNLLSRLDGEMSFKNSLQAGCAVLAGNDTDYAGRSYFVDIFGTTSNSQQQTITDIARYAQQFWELPDEHPVTLATNRKDGICNACAFGKHCEGVSSVPAPEHLEQGDSEVGKDFEYIERFKKAADKLGVSDSVQFLHEEGVAGTESAYAELRTTAAVARKILISKAFNRPGAENEENNAELKIDQDWKARRRQLRALQREEFWEGTEYTRARILHSLALLRPAIGAFTLFAALNTVFTAGEAVQSAQDAALVRPQAEQINRENTNEGFSDLSSETIKFILGGFAYTIFPRRRRTKEHLESIKQGQEYSLDEKSGLST